MTGVMAGLGRKRRGTATGRVVALGASMHAARTRARLRWQTDAARLQETIRGRLLRRQAGTAFGREMGISAGMTYREFRRRVRPRVYEELAPWIERMKRGDPDVLWPGRCRWYAVSSGTTQGRTKYLPVTGDLLGHFRRAGLDSLAYYALRAGVSVFGGRHLFLGGSTALARLPSDGEFAAWAGDLSGITARHLPFWAERFLYEPGGGIAQLADWPRKLEAIASRTVHRDIRLLAGIPSWILIFAEVVRRKTGCRTLKEVWPGLECLVHGGVPIDPYAGELQRALGPGVGFHEVYPASEAFIAAQDVERKDGLRLLVDAGVFFEFLPMNRFDESRLYAIGADALSVAEVQTGVDYALVLTTPGGLCRYVIGDIVRFVSTSPARLIYVGRTRLQLSAFGEHVIEKELTDALTVVCGRRGLVLDNFHVAPLFVERAKGRNRGRHEWWVEVRTPGAAFVDPSNAAAELDLELQRSNDDYEAKRLGGGLDAPLVHIVPHGTFERWLRRNGRWGGQSKMPRCRSDRRVADELAGIAGSAAPAAHAWPDFRP